MRTTHLIAGATMALAVAACASDPYYYNEPRYAPTSGYYYGGGNGAAYGDIGRVVAIDVERGGGSGIRPGGAIAGAIVGGVLGHQIGSGSGNDFATLAGALGGAAAGNEIAQRRGGGDEYYRVTVQFRDGREATFAQESLHGIRVGDQVRVADNRLYLD